MGRRFQGMTSDDQYNQVQLMTMSAIDFLDQWFETDVLKATMSASGIIGTFLGIRSPGTAYVLLHHYMGEIDGAFRSWGFAVAAPARFPMRSPTRPAKPAPKFAPKRRLQKLLSRMARLPASCSQRRRNLRERHFFQCRSASHFHRISSRTSICPPIFWRM